MAEKKSNEELEKKLYSDFDNAYTAYETALAGYDDDLG